MKLALKALACTSFNICKIERQGTINRQFPDWLVISAAERLRVIQLREKYK